MQIKAVIQEATAILDGGYRYLLQIRSKDNSTPHGQLVVPYATAKPGWVVGAIVTITISDGVDTV